MPPGARWTPPSSVRRKRAVRWRKSQAKLEQMTVRAPADGVLLTRAVEAGDVVTAGKTLLRFASDGPRRVLLDLDERDLGKVALGQTAAVLADAFPQQRAPAVVSRINASVDNARGTVEIELALTAAAEHLRSGMTVSAEILTRPAQATCCCWPPPCARRPRRPVGRRPRALVKISTDERDCRPVAGDGRPERRPAGDCAGAAAG